MNRKLVACNFSQLRFFVAASGHAGLEKFDSDVPRSCFKTLFLDLFGHF
jgi:hypothetical protein